MAEEITFFSPPQSKWLVILIPAAVFLLFLFRLVKVRNNKIIEDSPRSHLNLSPGSYGWPILGETLDFLRAGLDGTPGRFLSDRMEKYKSEVFKTSLMGEKMVVLGGASGNKFLFSNENKLVRLWWPASVRKLLGPCLTTKAGDEAKLMRKLLSYYVSPDAFSKFYMQIMDLVTQHHIKTHWQGKDQVKVFPTIKLYTFELACRLFMSLDDPQEVAELAALFNIFLKGIISIPFNFPRTRFYSAVKATNKIREKVLKKVKQRRLALEQKAASPSQDLLSHMISSPDESGKFTPEAEIVNNILMLLFAGHDTSSVTITLLMKTLAELPHVYDKVLQEQMDIASSKNQDEYLQWEDIQKMRYSWNVVAETMRLRPPVSGAFREALVDFKFGGYDIPKGWKIYWSAAFTHSDENLFPNNRSFDESRFDGSGPTPFSYIPFGGGPRMCLGKEFARLEILVFLHNVVKRFKWKLEIPNEKIIYDPMPTPLQGLLIRLQPHLP